ncbi:MAG: MBL fold metallo-hydrolase [Planctomycetota bacterium]
MTLSLEFLGTGTSVGVPMIGCDCAVCHSTDPRDKRLRSSAIIRAHAADGRAETTVLLDTTPDLRYQMLRANVRHIDAIVITHFHADHVMGIDDVRRFNIIQKQVIDVWGTEATLASMKKSFGYVFSDTLRAGWPSLRAREIKIGERFDIGGLNFLPFNLDHEVIINTGLKFVQSGVENAPAWSYCLDVKRIDEAGFKALEGTDTLVLDMLRESNHPTHMNFTEAMETVSRVKPRRAYFGHIAHEISHAAIEARLPENIRLAYDGMVVR